MTTLLLIRHGTFEGIGTLLPGRMEGFHLNREGRRQAERLAERLASGTVAAIFSSPRERACETAAPISRKLGLPFQVSDALDEIDFGLWSGSQIDDLDPVPGWKLFNTFRSHVRIPGGESMAEVQARVVAESERICCRYPDRVVALVTHGDIIRAALVHYAGMPIDLLPRIEISPGSASILEINQEGPRLIRINDTGCEPLLCGTPAPAGMEVSR